MKGLRLIVYENTKSGSDGKSDHQERNIIINQVLKEELAMKNRNATARKLIGYLFIMVLITLFSVPHWAIAADPGFWKKAPPSFANLAEEVKHSVVNISTTQVIKRSPLQPFFGPNQPFGDFFGRDFFKHFFGNVPQGEMKTHALGSGFVISRDGFILTNNHVIDKATEIKVKLESGKEYDAKVIGHDPKTDLALIQVKLDESFPTPAPLGDSGAIRVGDWVMAVGNPFGLGQTVTTGIISAKGRIIGAGPYDDFLQTDAAINPGNSGGPLCNMKGEVIGINTAIIAQGQGIGFAIPINMAKDLLPQLKKGKVIRGWLGVTIQDITPDLAKSFGFKSSKGALVSSVAKGSPAENAGLLRGDVILRFNGKEIENTHILSQLAAATAPNTPVKIDILRNGKSETITLTIGTMPAEEQKMISPKKETNWGMAVQELTPQLAEQLGLESGTTGVVISDIESGSPASEAGLRPGDLIREINRNGIENLDDYRHALKQTKKGDNLLLLIKRSSGALYIVLTPPTKDKG
jgi:serine protease Do